MSDLQFNEEEDLKLGRRLLLVIALLLIALSAVYIWMHFHFRGGVLSPFSLVREQAQAAIVQASTQLAAGPEVVPAEEAANWQELITTLSVQAPALGQIEVISATLTALNLELGRSEPRKAVLAPLLNELTEEVRRGPAEFFWSTGRDRWIEMGFWSVFGTLVFLLSELKFWLSHPGHNFKIFTPWYFANLLRGPFIAMLILFALTSVAVDIVGITLDVQQAPIEVLLFMAAILGFYSREAKQVLDDLVSKVFKGAWNKIHGEFLAITPEKRSLAAGASQEFTVRSSNSVKWWLSGPGVLEIKPGEPQEVIYHAPDLVAEKMEVLLAAEARGPDEECQRGQAAITLVPHGEPGGVPEVEAPVPGVSELAKEGNGKNR